MSTHAETASLYAALEQALGREPAETLMEQLPAGGRVATKDDLRNELDSLENSLRGEFGTRFDRIDDRFDQLHLSMHGYVRTFVIAQVTSIFGAVGLFFGINQLI